MNILYVYAHPNPTSFNGLLFCHGCEKLKQLKHNIFLSDLYADNFRALASWDDFAISAAESDPQYFLSQQTAYKEQALSQDIQAELKKLAWADHIIFQFPLWWFATPAILKGWFDRVLVKGFAYDTGKMFAEGLLRCKTASLVVTTLSPESAYRVEGVHGDAIEVFLHPIQHTLRFVGIQPLQPFIVYNAFNIDQQRREEIVDNYNKYLDSLS